MDLLLAENLELNVRVSEGEYCKLEIEYGKFPELTHVLNHSYFDQNDDEETEVVDFTSQHTPTYVLSGAINDRRNFSKLFRFVYKGKADVNNLKKVYFTIPELAVYFNGEISRNLERNGDLKGNVYIEPLETRVNIGEEDVKIGIYQSYRLSDAATKDGFRFTSSISVGYEFENPITFENIERYLYKSKNLFTWITGFPVKVSKVEVSDGENKGSLYIPTVKDTMEQDVSYPRSMILNKRLREYFSDICQGFFSDNKYEFENIWSRTIPLFSFNGVIEYETMLYAAILDKYCSYKVDELNLDVSLERSQYNEIIKRLSSLINDDEILAEFFSEGVLNNLGNEKILEETLPNRSASTFKQKVKQYLAHIGKNATEVFLSNDDLHLIKEVRDRAAHGEIETFTTDEVYRIYWKLRMLVMYLIFRDLGLDDQAFFKIISFTHHPLVSNCEVDDFKLESKMNTAIVLPVSEPVFKELSSRRQHNHIVLERDGNLYQASDVYTKGLADYFSFENSKVREINSLDEYVQTLITNAKHKSKYVGKLYIKHRNRTHAFYSTVLVDTPKKLAELNR